MNWLYAFLVTAPIVLTVWGLMDKESPCTVKAFFAWWSRDGLMVSIVIFMFALLWFSRGGPPETEMLTPEYP